MIKIDIIYLKINIPIILSILLSMESVVLFTVYIIIVKLVAIFLNIIKYIILYKYILNIKVPGFYNHVLIYESGIKLNQNYNLRNQICDK